MPRSIASEEFLEVIRQARENARRSATRAVRVGRKTVTVATPFPSPADWRDQLVYFLLVDRFNKQRESRTPPPFEEKTNQRLGGTFRGVTEKLDYLRELGVGAIWLSPIQKNTPDSIHGYSIQDFLAVDSRFGSEGDLIELIDQAHARGMYVIFDIVINHAGNVFTYQDAAVPFREEPYPILWHRADGTPNSRWKIAPADLPTNDPELTPEAAVYPDELRANEYFRRCGKMGDDERRGDFETLKEFVSERAEFRDARAYYPVRNLLILIHQYLIAKFDIDGLRIDTIKHVERDFSLVFGNAIREFALGLGKRNFFTFGEAKSGDEKVLAAYTGKYSTETGGQVGLDSTLDFPLMWTLSPVAKGFSAPAALAGLYEYRKRLLGGETAERAVVVSSHGEASRFYVTFCDNHDEHARLRHCPRGNDLNAPFAYDDQVLIALGCLFALQGIPCLYYGTEQGLRGDAAGDTDGGDWYVREALWGKPGGGFDRSNRFFQEIRCLGAVRAAHPALRYGRQYFRPLSGDGHRFGLSQFPGGVIAFSRVLNDSEVIVAANCSPHSAFDGLVIVDFDLQPEGAAMRILYSNKGAAAAAPQPCRTLAQGSVAVVEVDGAMTHGPVRALPLRLQPQEIQILAR